MTSTAVRVHRWRGTAAVTLRSGDLEATFVPELNLLGTSLRLAGQEFLTLPGGLGAYRRGHTAGLPLLAPWANRLGGLRYRSGRTRVDLEGLELHTDEGGLPIHGTMSARDAWDVTALSARGRVARLEANFAYERSEHLAVFPFPHRLEATLVVDGRSLSVTTVLRPTGDRPVPVSFGYHPYFRLPGSRRASWRLRLPRRLALQLDERGLPTGRRVEAAAESLAIGTRTFDDHLELVGARVLALEGHGRHLSLEYGPGYRFAQVFAPPEKEFVALEPMTAATNALVTGTCPVVRPGETFSATFRIRPGVEGPGRSRVG